MLQRLLRVFAADCCPTGLLVQKGLTGKQSTCGLVSKNLLELLSRLHWKSCLESLLRYLLQSQCTGIPRSCSADLVVGLCVSMEMQ
ncbi:Uncharacterized protein TCM_001196 [Theobroma cacao]|uniref:Uncharacterized protein n=1 Tax=Theobroma cacao TaxID=3641 RepID=A0A061DJT3_THECC|nr:Uncharacterized protein TCM_001196 [Theobroma cacao]